MYKSPARKAARGVVGLRARGRDHADARVAGVAADLAGGVEQARAEAGVLRLPAALGADAQRRPVDVHLADHGVAGDLGQEGAAAARGVVGRLRRRKPAISPGSA